MILDPLYLFVFAGLFSPGPNVVLLTASGARFGVSRTLPHIAGVVVGVGITAGVTGYGLGAVLGSWPALSLALKIVAAGWIATMAWRLARASANPRGADRDRPFTFVQAVLFQWVNPKVWAVAMAASAGYGLGLGPEAEAIRLAGAFSGLNLFVCLFWTAAGSWAASLLVTRAAWAVFLRVMAAALAVSAVLVFL